MPTPLLTAAATGYLLNCALGASVALRVLDTSGVRWVHHAVYVATAVLTAGAGAELARHRRPAFWRLLPVALPLSAIPAVSARSRWHPVIAGTAAPAYLAALRAS
ncbi:putative membrane protein YfcA [Kineococcus radiotolerans]|uniref:Putative membrane protein YfcA n=1 Tax=Kineococcus radiotolerans TaxID=131568 RepID=A0A7W4TIG3_KINRA|nr:hypothetical protein [Kineococcus radiotolerans]MBB2899496.1 putative membrane protein YfcA [Kineococcus radiotolerans]